MTDIYHQVGVRTEIEKTFDALTTLEGLSGWWTQASGEPSEGGKLHFHFGETVVEMTVLQLKATEKIVWQCTEKQGEWKDTIISFELNASGEQIFINFSHTGWAAQTDLCVHCSTKWAVFLLSLKDYLEKGKGQPFPDDLHINGYLIIAIRRQSRLDYPGCFIVGVFSPVSLNRCHERY